MIDAYYIVWAILIVPACMVIFDLIGLYWDDFADFWREIWE